MTAIALYSILLTKKKIDYIWKLLRNSPEFIERKINKKHIRAPRTNRDLVRC